MISTNNITYLRIAAIIIPLIALIFSLYFLILMPQKQQMDAQRQARKQIRMGSRVTTHHGLSGRVCSLSDNFIILELDDGRKIEIFTQTIATIDHENH